MTDVKKMALIAAAIPVEMYWAYEAVRRSSHWNMMVFNPMFGRYHNGTDHRECLKVMDDCYIKFCIHNNADISQSEYKHIMVEHVLLIQELYNDLQNLYPEMPEDIVNIKREVKTSISF